MATDGRSGEDPPEPSRPGDPGGRSGSTTYSPAIFARPSTFLSAYRCPSRRTSPRRWRSVRIRVTFSRLPPHRLARSACVTAGTSRRPRAGCRGLGVASCSSRLATRPFRSRKSRSSTNASLDSIWRARARGGCECLGLRGEERQEPLSGDRPDLRILEHQHARRAIASPPGCRALRRTRDLDGRVQDAVP